MTPSLTVIITAFNEARQLKNACETTSRAIQKSGIKDYEILIASVTAPDGSHDGTPDIAALIAKEDSRVKSLHTNGYVGMGYKYRESVMAASKDYIIMIPGANHILESTLVDVFNHIGRASVVLTYTKSETRPFYVRFVSKSFVILCNLLFSLNMKYFNGITLYPRELLLKVPMTADSPAYNAEILIYLLKSNVDYIELPQEINPNTTSAPGRTFMLKNVLPSLKSLISLLWKVRFQRKRIALSQKYHD